MGRRAKSSKGKAQPKRSPARKPPENEPARVRDLEKRLRESLEREKSKDRALTEALGQQTATAEVLKVISRSTFELPPVLDTLIENAARLCGARRGVIFRRDSNNYHGVAFYNTSPETIDFVRAHPISPGRHTITARVALERRTIHVADVQADPEYGYVLRDEEPIRTELGVPMFRGDEIAGVIILFKVVVEPFTDKQIELVETFADQAVIAIENVRLFKELEARNRDLTESLEQQTATSDILRVISSSPTDVQPVFDAVAESARQLCNGEYCVVESFDGERLHFGASDGLSPDGLAAFRQALPRPVSEDNAAGRAVLRRMVAQIPDVLQDPTHGVRNVALAANYRSVVAVPMLRDGQPIGAIVVARSAVGLFPERQIALLQTFADQAVIAIENVRLFTELQEKNKALTQAHAQVSEALDQQTATSEVLKVISRSAFDLEPVLDTLIENAVRLCGAERGFIHRQVGDFYPVAASYGHSPEWIEYVNQHPIRRDRGSATGRAALERRVVHIGDIRADPEYRWADDQRGGEEMHRTVLSVPMLRDGDVLGVITIRRPQVQPFTPKQIELVTTFADQAVIAIENVRLFKELEARNRALVEALEQQTATSEILRVISSSPTDVQPVFDTIVASAVRLCGARMGAAYRFDGELVHLIAHHNYPPDALKVLQQMLPRPPQIDLVPGRAILARAVVQLEDVLTDPHVPRELTLAGGWRSILAVPMLRDAAPIGVIVITRNEVGRFADAHIDLLRTFADQAVIAIENVRLFTELQEKNQALTQAHAQVTESLEQQTATAEILRVISQSQTEVQPVFDAIVDNAMRLFRAWAAAIVQLDGQLLHLIAVRGGRPGLDQYLREQSPWSIHGPTPVARCIAQRTVIHVADTELDRYADEAIREIRSRGGMRSVLAAPMLRKGQPIGGIWISRAVAGPFSPAEIALLQTFADQAVIAIQNAQLLGELRARTEELTRSVDQLTALGEVSRAVSSTLDLETVLTTIVSRAVELSGLDGGVVFEYDENAEEFVQRAMTETSEALADARRTTRIRKGEGVLGRTAMTLEPVQVPDIALPGAYEGRLRETLIVSGVRAILAVPMVREGQLIGCLAVTRNQPGDFPAETIELLRTFTTQSALAIQNARLFQEVEDKSRQLEAASQHKSEFLANMSHELRTPLNAIIGFSEVLNERMFGELNDKQAEYLKDIYASGQHLLSLINDILDLSKIEAGKMELEAADFDLPSAIDNALILVRERATRRRITLGRTVDDRLGTVCGDERKVKQVLLNLLSNALKFTPEGGRIDVSAHLQDGAAEIAVADTGVGIAPEDQEAIFEEFRQVGTADKKVEGTGLGLALSRKFIELHGGRIWVKSELGKGSMFTFTLPVRREPGDREARPH